MTETRRRGPYAHTALRRREIVDSAMTSFAARGYRATSLREIARESGIALSTLVHHFPDKESLLVEVLRRRDEIGADTLAEDGSGFVSNVIARAKDNESLRGLIEIYTVLAAEASTADHPGRDYFVGRFRKLELEYGEHFAEYQRAGRLRPGTTPSLAATSLVALWDGLQLQWLTDPERVDVAAHLEAFLALALIGSDDEAGPGATAPRPARGAAGD